MPWTPAHVEARLKEAALVLLLLPDRERRYRLGTRSNWPSVVLEAAEAYGYVGDPGYTGKAMMRVPGQAEPVTGPELAIPRDVDLPAHARIQAKFERHGVVNMAGAIDRMDEALPWLGWLGARQRRIVWRRLEGTPWNIIAAIERRSERTAQRWHAEALAAICDELVTREWKGG